MKLFKQREPILSPELVSSLEESMQQVEPVTRQQPVPRSETRDLMLQAAEAHDSMARRNQELEDGIRKAIAHLEAGKNEVEQYKLLLAQERNNSASYRTERDDAFKECARLEAGLANCRAILEQLGLPPPSTKRRRNGKSASDVAVNQFEPTIDLVTSGGEAPPVIVGSEVPKQD